MARLSMGWISVVYIVTTLLLLTDSTSADWISELDRCYDVSSPLPCGANARWQSGGVLSGINFEDLTTIDPNYAQKLSDTLGTSEAEDLTYTRIPFSLYYDEPTGDPPPGAPAINGGTSRCIIQQIWDLTSSVPNLPQCALNGPCTDTNTCRTLLDGQGSPVSFRLDITADDLFYALPLGAVQASIPFERMQYMRRKQGMDPNDDEEDNHVVNFSGSNPDDDSDYLVNLSSGQLGTGSGSDDDTDITNGAGVPLFLDDDNDNTLNDGDDDDRGQDQGTALQNCYSGNGSLMSVIGHLYDPSADQDLTWSCGGNHPASCPTTDNQASRVLNMQTAFGTSTGMSPAYMYSIADTGILSSDAARASENPCTPGRLAGCPIGPLPADWDIRANGDDEDDDSDDDDDDDDLNDTTPLLSSRADGVEIAIEQTYLTGEWAQTRNNAPSLGRDLYTRLTRQRSGAIGGQMKKVKQTDGIYYTAPTISYCKSAETYGKMTARRYVQHDITPGCNVYTLPTVDTNTLKPIWSVAARFTRFNSAGTTTGTSTDFVMTSSASEPSDESGIVNGDDTSPYYGNGATFTLVQGHADTSPVADLDGVYAAVICESDPGYSFTDPAMAVDPFRRLEGRGRGSTLMQQGLAASDPDKVGEQAVYILNEIDYLSLSGTCNDVGPVTQVTGTVIGISVTSVSRDTVSSVGYTGGGVQDTDLGYPESGQYDTGMFHISWKLGMSAFGDEQQEVWSQGAALCRPYNQPDNVGIDSVTPSGGYAMAKNNEWMLSQDGLNAAPGGSYTDTQANDAFSASVAGRFSSVGFRVAPSPSQWVYLPVPEVATGAYIGVAPSTPFYNDPSDDNPTAEVVLYIPSSSVVAGPTALAVSNFDVVSTNLCPLLETTDCSFSAYEMPDTQEEINSECGSSLFSINIDSQVGAIARFNFDECTDQGIVPFCSGTDEGCGIIVSQSFSVSQANTDDLRTRSAVYFASTATVTCDSSCNVYLEQQVGSTWVALISQFVPPCSTSADTAIAGCNVSASPTGTPTPSMSGTPLPSLSVDASPYPSASPSTSSTNTASITVSPSVSRSTDGTRSSGAELASQTASPSASTSFGAPQSPSPSLSKTASKSVSPEEDPTSCTTFDIGCKCDYDDLGDAYQCWFSFGGILTWVGLAVAVLVCLLLCSVGGYILYRDS